jgi:hypothetical protein
MTTSSKQITLIPMTPEDYTTRVPYVVADYAAPFAQKAVRESGYDRDECPDQLVFDHKI